MASIQARKNLKGEIKYTVQVRLKGFPPQVATFQRLTDAKKWAQATESAIRENRYFQHSEAKKHTVSDMTNRYLQRIEKKNPKRLKDVKAIIDWWENQIGSYRLSDLSRSLLSQQVEVLMERKVKRKNKEIDKTELVPIGPARVNRYLSVLSHACTIAVNEWEWLSENPMRKISKMKEPRGRDRFLNDEERNALLQACSMSDYKSLYLIVVLTLSTGMRRGEVMNLRWVQVDLSQRQIILHETKNGEKRCLPLRGHALELIKQHQKLRRIDTNMLFSSEKGDKPYEIKRSWNNALKRAGVSDFRFHDLRHSAASYLAMNGASLPEIAEVLGHKSFDMVKRYAHLSHEHTGNVVENMNERIFGNV